MVAVDMMPRAGLTGGQRTGPMPRRGLRCHRARKAVTLAALRLFGRGGRMAAEVRPPLRAAGTG